jgi:hypothetical protein
VTNLKPADELWSVRQKIKELKAREDELRDGILGGALDTHGDFAIATITKRNQKRFDRKAAETELGSLSRFDSQTEITMIRVEELSNPDAA